MACTIRNMDMAEMEIAAYLAYKEGWNPGHADGWAFFKADPKGFFIAEIDSRVVGCISAVKYSNEFGFIGFYVVEPEYRGTTAGTQLAIAALNYLERCNIGIDGVLDKVKNYERIGFKQAYKNSRFEGIGNNFRTSENLVFMDNIDKQLIYKYDLKCFPAERHNFIDAWLEMPNIHAYAQYKNGKLGGWGVIRPCRKGFKIGPLFADSFPIADNIYKALASHAVDELIYIDIPEKNDFGVQLAAKHDMRLVFETVRMYTKKEPDIDLQKVFGVTSFELG